MRALFIFAAVLLLATSASADDARSIRGLSHALAALSPRVDPAEAEVLARTAHVTARALAREYRVVGPPLFQNFLIHIGVRQRGYCFQWARDIGRRLKALHLKTLELHWGAAYPGTLREHNCIVVTARGEPFESGYIIDGWRHAGRLFWERAAKDHYDWHQDMEETARLQSR
ncbi:MAG: hypothetical protein ACREP1_11945, partial [Rhodanobacteraceae bacterium]